jgi:urease accessory protein
VNSELRPWLAWQLVDSAFPTGGFAHSSGLESAWQHGEIAAAGDLRIFLRWSVQQAGHATLPLVNAAHDAPDRFEELDALTDAFLINAVANRASRVQGRTLVATTARIWPSEPLELLKARAAGSCAHVAPTAGAAFRLLGVPLATVQQVVMFGVVRGIISAAVRLGIAGTFEAQRLQWECGPWLDEVLSRCGGLREDDLAQTAPVLDLLQAGHDRLYSRLFQS